MSHLDLVDLLRSPHRSLARLLDQESCRTRDATSRLHPRLLHLVVVLEHSTRGRLLISRRSQLEQQSIGLDRSCLDLDQNSKPSRH